MSNIDMRGWPYGLGADVLAPVDQVAANRVAVAKFLRTAGKLGAAAAAGYHGVKHNRGSVGWGLWWFGSTYLLPGVASAIPLVIAAGQGYAKPKACPPCDVR
jgi:hypothetical protein